MAPNTAKFHYILACIATAMLFGMVSGHFRVGRELYVWPWQPGLWQIHPLDQESPGQRQSSEWFQRSKEENTGKGNKDERKVNNLASTIDGKVFHNHVGPGDVHTSRMGLARRKKQTFPERKPLAFSVSESQSPVGVRKVRVKKNQIAP